VWNMLAVCRCLLRLGFRVCSYDFVLLASYACMRKMRSCCVLGCRCRCLLRLRFRIYSHGLILLYGYSCTRKKMVCWCVLGWRCRFCFVYGLGFIHMVWSCILVMPVREKKLFLDVFWDDGVDVWFVYGHGFVHIVYVPKLDTANHLGELS